MARTVRDLAESETFYGAVLGLPHLSSAGPSAAFDADGTRLLLTEHRPPAADESVLTLAVPELAAAVHRLRAAGVTVRGPPRIPHRQADGAREGVASFDDPAGRPRALVAWDAPRR